MSIIYSALKFFDFISYFAVLFAIAVLFDKIKSRASLRYIIKDFIGEEELIYYGTKIACILALIGIFFSSPFTQHLFHINDIRLKQSGEYCYMVKSGTAYYPAKIKVTEHGSENDYEIKELYYKDTTLYFDDEEYLGLNSLSFVQTTDNKECGITLLNEHCPTTEFTEAGLSPLYIILFIIKISSVILVLYSANTSFKISKKRKEPEWIQLSIPQ